MNPSRPKAALDPHFIKPSPSSAKGASWIGRAVVQPGYTIGERLLLRPW